MKTGFAFALLFSLSLSFAACSKCYDCTQEITVAGQTQTTDPEEICTSDQSEIDEREAAGQTCTAR
ncbi:MAG: hypothetical protein ACFB10_05355 [Salibacteraceae bacterium]|mgnify:CR=1 FL=1